MNKANECTCPSGDGSLVHPCPAHPAVEQAGGDERAAFEAYRDRRNALIESEGHNPGSKWHVTNAHYPTWEASREAMAQPSPAQAEAERPEVAEVAFVLRNIGAMDAEDIDGDNVDLRFEDAEGRDTGCDVSIVEYAEKAADLLEQQDRIVGELRADRDSWAEQAEQRLADWDEMRKERDAALARVAELERQEPVALANRGLHAFWVKWTEAAAGLYGPGIKLYAAPVAQAQHSVPDVCDGKEQNAFEDWASKEGMNMERHPLHWLFLDAKTYSARQGWKAALKYARNMLAAAPVCRLSRSALTEAQMRRLYENSTETENERLGFEAFARLIRRAEAVHQITAAPGKEGV